MPQCFSKTTVLQLKEKSQVFRTLTLYLICQTNRLLVFRADHDAQTDHYLVAIYKSEVQMFINFSLC